MGRAITLLGGVSLAAGESVVAVAEPLGHENTTLRSRRTGISCWIVRSDTPRNRRRVGGRGTKAGNRSWLTSETPYLEGILILWQVLDSNKSGGFLARGDTAQTAAD
jgi:hypothetical protein